MPRLQFQREWVPIGKPYTLWWVKRPVSDGGGYLNISSTPVVQNLSEVDEETFGQTTFRPGYIYYVTLAQARVLIDGGVKDVYYLDDYNDEYQDAYVGTVNLDPNVPATVKEPIV